MSNGKITDAEIELELSGDRRSIDRLLLTGQKEIAATVAGLVTSVDAMREVCEQRGLMCPGMHSSLADPVTSPTIVPAAVPAEDKRVWLMWGAGSTLLERVGLPLVVVLITLALSRAFG